VTTEIRVPQLPESVADATLVAWHKKPGEAVKRDENLADLETDKVVLEVPAPFNGVLREIRIQSGASVTSGQVLRPPRKRLPTLRSSARPCAAWSRRTSSIRPASPAPAATAG
jgi:2-oxoglutarate dehydrogenase E2 component (dihydrolipoamide succinyltransferase)